MGRHRKNNVRRRANIDDGTNNFVRSRTIKSPELAANQNKREAQLERAKQKKRHNRRRRLMASTVGVVVVLMLAAFMASQYVLGIGFVNYSGSSPIGDNPNQDSYIESADEYLMNHIASRFSLFIRDDDFSSYMVKNHPEVASASIKQRPFMDAGLEIVLREPVAVWESASGREYVDANGVIFASSVMSEPGVIIKDESGLNVDGAAVASSRFLNFVGQLISRINDDGRAGKVESVSIPLSAIRYIELRLSGRPYPIKAHIDRDIDSQADDIINTVRFLDQRNLTPGYVDVRVKNKAYYK